MKLNPIKIWKEKGKILEGIKNNIFKKDHIEDIAKERMAICKICPHIDHIGKSCAVPGTQPCCGDCGCKLSWKTRSLSSSCPKNYWKALLTEDEEDKLEHEINKNK